MTKIYKAVLVILCLLVGTQFWVLYNANNTIKDLKQKIEETNIDLTLALQQQEEHNKLSQDDFVYLKSIINYVWQYQNFFNNHAIAEIVCDSSKHPKSKQDIKDEVQCEIKHTKVAINEGKSIRDMLIDPPERNNLKFIRVQEPFLYNTDFNYIFHDFLTNYTFNPKFVYDEKDYIIPTRLSQKHQRKDDHFKYSRYQGLKIRKELRFNAGVKTLTESLFPRKATDN